MINSKIKIMLVLFFCLFWNLPANADNENNITVSPDYIYATQGDVLWFRAWGISGPFIWSSSLGVITGFGNSASFTVPGEDLFYIWVTDGVDFGYAIVDSRPETNDIILLRAEPSSLSLLKEENSFVSVLGYRVDGILEDLTLESSFQSSDESIFTINSDAQVTALAAGEAYITVSWNDFNVYVPVKVDDTRTFLIVDPDLIIVDENDNVPINVYESDVNRKAVLIDNPEFKLLNEEIAQLDDNYITGIKAGTTYIEVKYQDLITQVPLIVKPVPDFSITPLRSIININDYLHFNIAGGKKPYKVSIQKGIIVEQLENSFIYQGTEAGSVDINVYDNEDNLVTAKVEVITPLVVTPSEAVLKRNESINLKVQGGDGNYIWGVTQGVLSVVSGIETTYTPPDRSGIHFVGVRDSSGNQEEVRILVGDDLVLSPEVLFVTPEEQVNINIMSGLPPYEVHVNAGSATIESNKIKYTSPDVAGSYNLTVIDGTDEKSIAKINVSLSLIVSPQKTRIGKNKELEIFASGGLGSYHWSATRGKITEYKEKVLWTSPDVFGPVKIHVTDDSGQVATIIADVTSEEIAVTPSILHIYPGDKDKLTVVGGLPPYTWSSEAGDIDQNDSAAINYTAPNVKGSYWIKVVDNSGKEAGAILNVYKSGLILSPQTLYVGAGETAKISVSGGTGKYSLWSSQGKLNDALKLEINEEGNVSYCAPANYEGIDTINILDTAGNLETIQVVIMKGADIISIYTGADNIIDDWEMEEAIKDFMSGHRWIDSVTMYKLIEIYLKAGTVDN